ncbi:hypothetical protein F5Y04DRAFT_254284 [Hypomontagnella monticulosa]|nr:hypothetical protein F5Y04DRAFT_254284 [Hypomontagnella monticulosa]
MAAASDPPEESVTLFCDITGLLRDEAITRLKANNNDIQQAAGEYFEDPDSRKYKWDESQFSVGRQGEVTDTGISFNIQGPDELPPTSYQNNAAPTRPPSRANNPSPFGAPANAAEEDANLERALAESAAESGIQLQETGVVDTETNLKYFGPANRPQYETEQWAMIPTKATNDPVNTDPLPSNRQRDADTPSFLRQTKDHRVGSILSIYHKIPLIRNILLQCGTPSKNYGHNSEWWRGQPILKHEHLAAMARGEPVWDDEAHPEFVEELHRLMAFLDRTDRSYGTADSLVDTKAIDPNFGTWMSDVEDKLFEAIRGEAANNPDCDINPMTTIGTILPCTPLPATGSPTEDSNDNHSEEERDTPFVFLDVQLDSDQYSWVETIYDALDHLLWAHALTLDSNFPEDANYAVLSKASEVVTIRLGGTGLVKPCEIPAVLYVDRYMKERRDLALKFQTYIRFAKKKLRMYNAWESSAMRCEGQRCHRVNGLGNEPHNVGACLEGIVKDAEKKMQRQTRTAQWRYFWDKMQRGIELSLNDIFLIHTWSGPYSFLPEEEERMEKWKEVIDGCTKELEKLKADFENLAELRQMYLEGIARISKRLTCKEHEADNDRFVFRGTSAYNPEYWNPTHKYSLRGVALTSELSYVCVREYDDSVVIDGEPMRRDQWWKIAYYSNDATPIKTQKATLEEVLDAAGTESRNPILVYASEAAMEIEPIPLSDALRMFVRADNRSFQQELAQERDQVQEQASSNPQPSGFTVENVSQVPAYTYAVKRKHSIGSSVATRGSSRNDLDDVDLTFDETDQFQDHQTPSIYYKEFADNKSPRSNKLGGIVESLANCRTNEDLNGKQTSSATQPDVEHGTVEEMQGITTGKSPEMQERTGGYAPFLGRSGQPTQGSAVDMMDIDLDADVEFQSRGDTYTHNR